MRQAGELKHLSTGGKEEILDSLSSGERKGKSPNPCDVMGGSRCRMGVVGLVMIHSAGGSGSYKVAC